MEKPSEQAFEDNPLNPIKGVLRGMSIGLAIWVSILLPIWFFARLL